MDELAMMMQPGRQEASLTRLIDTQRPDMQGSQKRVMERIVLSDAVSWSLNNTAQNVPLSVSTINISNKGILDLKRSYLQFAVTPTNCQMFTPHIFEVISWQIGSNLQVQLPFNGPLMDFHHSRREREEHSRDGVYADPFFATYPADPTTITSLGAISQGGLTRVYKIPISSLCEQFAAMEHVFVGLGQPLQIQLRLRPAGQVTCGGVSGYTVGKGQLILSYVELDQASMDKVVRSRIQFLMPHHQTLTVPFNTSVCNMQFSVNKKDFIRYLVIQSVGPACTAEATAVAQQLGDFNTISGILRPQIPIRRIQITVGQQNLVLQSQGLDEATDFLEANLSSFPHSFQDYRLQRLFGGGFAIDLSRFGLEEDAWGAGVETQTVLVQFQVNGSAPLYENGGGVGRFFGAAGKDGAVVDSRVTLYGYLCSAVQVSIENGLYKRD